MHGTDAASVTSILLMLAALVSAARLGGFLVSRIGQPAVLGELIAGIIVGPSLLGFVNPTDPYIHLLAEFGVVILLFQIGLHTDLRSLIKVGPSAVAVGGTGVALPFIAGYGIARLLGVPTMPAIVCGAAMTATSIGVSARLLGDLGALRSREGQTVLGAAVLDDVLGLIILAVVATMAAGGDVTTASVARTSGVAIGFVVLAVAIGSVAAPRIFTLIDRIPLGGTTGTFALAFALLMAALADLAGSALIIGAFAAGLTLHHTPQREEIEEFTGQLGHFFVPLFFASVGASVSLGAMVDPDALLLGVTLLVLGIASKFAAGYAPFWAPIRHAVVGVAMVPRGEVGLIFARMGLATAVLTPEYFGALMLMVIGTTFVVPPWLSWLLGGPTQPGPLPVSESRDERESDTLEDLVSGDTED